MASRALARRPLSITRGLVAARSLHATTPSLNDKPKPAPTTTTSSSSSSTTAAAAEGDKVPSQGFLGSLFYGSEHARAEGDIKLLEKKQHSKTVGRGKYVHEKITHAVIPGHRDAYLEAAEAYFTTLAKESYNLGNVKLCGSWETIVGAVGNFTHILEHEGYKGYDETRVLVAKNQTLQKHLNNMLPHLQTRQHQLMSEFVFLPMSPPRDSGYPDGGVFELRTYQLQPGKLLEWESAWRRGVEARLRFVQPVGGFFGQVGQLHEVHHIWQYPDMATRQAARGKAWTIGGWADTVQQTSRLTQTMKTTIMLPTSWSPLR
ncbi:hypothetical protein CcaverHIS002_0604470 [Cutaneotrichosporon cavernicola]|uniref:NIPSNAP domain-containing protein n=1 Tax=Cutaneotrichosporon cavernicola TaxID=279322 RepID=A0AA48L8M7_9TREE|nr:uncharacterized protein CcaverHIS019_0603940 [Cutaneotrichosporon cavernicola]BEI86160.1 hypothetical protein CcaverHIS002_0604470 [Cutaneotrichosporon cavernicola]BEI93935.1 hypothetical protein CcaverHIS019_0603940 [Cutaneotrichosporon cavernicola]